MVEKFYCPQCKTENNPSASQCIHCGFHFSSIASDSSSESDWLTFLRDSQDDNQKDEPLFSDNSDNSLELLDDSEEDSPDWLNRIRDIKQTDNEFEKLESRKSMELHPTKSTENDDLIKSLREEEKKPADETVDWISDFRNSQETNSEDPLFEEEQAGQSEDTVSDTASTLAEIKKNWQKEFPTTPISEGDDENVLPAEDFPDWLTKNISNISSEEEIIDDAGIPDWLTPGQDDDLGKTTKSKEPFDLPEWLSKTNFLVDEEIDPSLESESSAESKELSDFLKEINPEKEKEEVDNPISEEDSEMDIKETYDSVLLFNKLDILPDEKPESDGTSDHIRTSDLEPEHENIDDDQKQPDETAFILEDTELESLSVSPFIGMDENYDWLNNTILSDPESNDEESNVDNQGYEIEETSEEKEESFTPFTLGTVPDWLKNVDLEDFESANSQSNEDGNIQGSSQIPEIEKGNLPEWLKAIRPIEAVSPDLPQIKPQKRVEKSGPLAGFKGVLSSENVAKKFSPPPAYSATINVTEKQKTHLKILEEIISPAVSEAATKKKPQSFIQRVEIYLIPIFLLFIVLYSTFIDYSDLNFPENLPPDAVRFHTLATGYLNRNETPEHILVIFETDASSYPELNMISEGFFENLFLNNHWVTSISTNPNGVLLSEKILQNVSLKVPSYNYDERSTNLGYLPGYGTGIQAFLLNPKETSPGIDITTNIWGNSALAEINSIYDFDIIVLVTDNSENAKLWIEQIHLFVEDSNLILITTTKAAPLIQPYLITNQVDGMLSGITGGLAFKLLSQTEPKNIGRYWAIIQLVAIVFIFFILAGGVVTIFNKAYSEDSGKIK